MGISGTSYSCANGTFFYENTTANNTFSIDGVATGVNMTNAKGWLQAIRIA
jgi:hypothetical protein